VTAGAAAGTAAARYRRRSLRRTAFVACAFAAMAATLLLDILVGPGNLPAREVLATLIDPAAALVRLNVIVWDVRLPVAVMAVCSLDPPDIAQLAARLRDQRRR